LRRDTRWRYSVRCQKATCSGPAARLSQGCRITAGSQIRGTKRLREDTRGHEGPAMRVQEGTGGHVGILEDTAQWRFGTVRPRGQIPGPRPSVPLFELANKRRFSKVLEGRRQLNSGDLAGSHLADALPLDVLKREQKRAARVHGSPWRACGRSGAGRSRYPA